MSEPEQPATEPEPHPEPATGDGFWWRVATFVVGAVILILEIELMAGEVRSWVIGLALVLMGVVTVDQIRTWMAHRS